MLPLQQSPAQSGVDTDNDNNALSLVKIMSNPWAWSAGIHHQSDHPDYQFLQACFQDDIKAAEEALQNGAGPWCEDSMYKFHGLYHYRPLHFCIENNNIKLAELIKQNYDHCFSDRLYFHASTTLQFAASKGHYEMCKWIIEQNDDSVIVNTYDKHGRTPLMEAAANGSLEIIQLLIENGADPNIEDRAHHSALSYCLDSVTVTDDGADCRYMKCAMYLIDNGANVQFVGRVTKKSLVHYAVIFGDLDLVKRLVEKYKCPLDYVDSEGKRPRDYALEHGEIEEYFKLFDKFADIEIPCVVL